MNTTDLIAVIRSTHERTSDLCRVSIQNQIPKENVFIINEYPFEKALRTCYEIGIDGGSRWMLTVDADVLLKEGAIQSFLRGAEDLPDHFFQIEGLLHDKLTGMYRNVGHRLYRTQYLKLAIKHIPDPGETIRPEFETVNHMKKLGYDSAIISQVFGIHDYEQYFSDIYRKAFTHAKKHQDRLSVFADLWSREMTLDNDFVVAMRGLYDGLMFKGKVAIDSREFVERSRSALSELGLSEKGELHPAEDIFPLTQSVLEKVGPVPSKIITEIRTSELMKMSRNQRLRKEWRRLGTLRFILYYLGSTLRFVGNEIRKRADIGYNKQHFL